MPMPKKQLPPEAGYPGLPINDDVPELKKAFTFFNEQIRPRREFVVDEVCSCFIFQISPF
jgi:hypothetical protein